MEIGVRFSEWKAFGKVVGLVTEGCWGPKESLVDEFWLFLHSSVLCAWTVEVPDPSKNGCQRSDLMEMAAKLVSHFWGV